MRTTKLLFLTALLSGILPPAFAGPICDAAEAGDTAMVRHLLNSGVNVEEKSQYGCSPLRIAAFKGHTEIVKLLLDSGAAINARDKDGRTALTQAVDGARPETVKLLLSRGADLDASIMGAPNVLELNRLWKRIEPPHQNRYQREEIERLLLNAPQLRLEYQKAQLAAREQETRLAAAKISGQINMLTNAPLSRLLGKQALDNGEYVEALTDAIITAKNNQLPDLLATASSKQKIDLLTSVEKQIARATAGIDEANAEAGTAVSKGHDPVPFRKRAGQIKAYINVLNEIKAILEQS